MSQPALRSSFHHKPRYRSTKPLRPEALSPLLLSLIRLRMHARRARDRAVHMYDVLATTLERSLVVPPPTLF